MVSGEPDQLSASLEALTTEFERARRYGFDEGELERVLRGYRSSLQADFDASDTVQDVDYISGYVDHFLSGSPIPDADTSFQIYDSIYDDVTPEAHRFGVQRTARQRADYMFSWSAPTRSPTRRRATTSSPTSTDLPDARHRRPRSAVAGDSAR